MAGLQPPYRSGNGLEVRVARGSREGNRIAHILHAGDIVEQSFKTQAKTGVRHRAIAAQIAVPPQLLLEVLIHSSFQHIQALFALAAANTSP